MKTLFAALLMVWAYVLPVVAQDEYCAHGPDEPHVGAPDPKELLEGLAADIPKTGPFRALVVYFRFLDDSQTGGCSNAKQRWTNPDDVPVIDLLTEPTPGGGVPSPPFNSETLTRYFYDQSNEQFTLYGDVYPEVIVTQNNEVNYRVGTSVRLDRRAVTIELMDKIQADGLVNLSDYDANNDGYIDHIFFVLRQFNPFLPERTKFVVQEGNGPAGISSLEYSSPAPEYGTAGNLKRLDSGRSGSYNWYKSPGIQIPELDLVRLLAHEFGHDMWTNSVTSGAHIFYIGGNEGVPGNGSRRLGYGLMVGSLTNDPNTNVIDTRGDMTISAWERDILNAGWISCSTLTGTGHGITIGDLYDTTNNCKTTTIPRVIGATTEQYQLYLSNRQRLGFFDVVQTEPCAPVDLGLLDTGLLVHIARDNRNLLGTVAADNTLDLSLSITTYDGDLFDEDEMNQLTPWSRPNINGFATTYPTNIVMQTENWKALDNIRRSGNNMVFDFLPDFRNSPKIRVDSWMGFESTGITLTGTTHVTNESVLTISEDITITNLTIDPDAEVLVETGVTVTVTGNLTIQNGGRLHVRPGGLLTAEGLRYLGHSISVNADTYLDEFQDNTPHDGLQQIEARGNTGALGGTARSGMMIWDLTSIITNNITSAKIRLNITDPTILEGFEVRNLRKPWSAGGATWIDTGIGNDEWDSAGATGNGDRGSLMGTLNPTNTGSFEVSFNAYGLGIANEWIGDPANNNGVIVAGGLTNGNSAIWSAQESSNDPILEVTYVETVQASITLNLAGPYNGSGMNTDLLNSGLLPLSHPYSGQPWSYGGSENVAFFPSGVVDWVLVELITGNPSSPPMNVKARTVAFLKSDGSIVGLNGVSPVKFNVPLSSYFVVVRHRNHLDVMTSTSVSFVSGNATLNFTTSQSQAYTTGANPMMEVATGVFGLWGGDGSADGSVTAFDFLNFWLPINGGPPGYNPGDFNLDGSGTAFDYLQVWLPANGYASQVPDTDLPDPLVPAMKMVTQDGTSTLKGRMRTRNLDRNKVELALDFKALSTATLGTSTIWISYDPSAISYPFRPTEGTNADFLYARFHENDNSNYTSSVTHPFPGIISVNIALKEAGRGSTVSRDVFSEALALRFDVLNPELNPNFSWLRCEISDGDRQTVASNCSGFAQDEGLADFNTVDQVEERINGPFEIEEAYPNPFNPVSRFTLQVAQEQNVRVELFDITGRLVRTIHRGILSPSKKYVFSVDGTNLPSGSYLYRVTGEVFQATKQLVLLK